MNRGIVFGMVFSIILWFLMVTGGVTVIRWFIQWWG